LLKWNCKENEKQRRILMKKKTKKFITGIIIFISTLAAGFSITAISFSLFDSLTNNQMRILFGTDVIMLLIIGTIAWFIYESKLNCTKKSKESEQRHNDRMQRNIDYSKELSTILDYSNFAA